jgi:hypothetical protein
MVICFGGHCYEVVVIDWWPPYRPGPGPINYPALISDATLVASVQAAGEHAYDDRVRAALQGGIDAAVQAMQDRAAEGVEVRNELRAK